MRNHVLNFQAFLANEQNCNDIIYKKKNQITDVEQYSIFSTCLNSKNQLEYSSAHCQSIC